MLDPQDMRETAAAERIVKLCHHLPNKLPTQSKVDNIRHRYQEISRDIKRPGDREPSIPGEVPLRLVDFKRLRSQELQPPSRFLPSIRRQPSFKQTFVGGGKHMETCFLMFLHRPKTI